MTLTNSCPLCLENEEIVNLLLHCTTRVLWDLLLSLFSIYWVMPNWVRVSFIAKENKKIWRAGPFCIFWVIWTRNDILFRDEVLCIQRLNSSFVHISYRWRPSFLFLFFMDGSTTLVDFLFSQSLEILLWVVGMYMLDRFFARG